MRIKMKTISAGPEGIYGPGSIRDVDDNEGIDLVAGGFATSLDSPMAEEIGEPKEVKEPEPAKVSQAKPATVAKNASKGKRHG